ncbi:S9 family peptidase [soil metagenome]
MKAADLGALRSVSRPAMHPDGSRIVVSVTRPDVDSDSTVGQLFTIPIDGSGSRRITRGFRDTDPAFSPDGLALAFLRASHGGVAQLHVVTADGGEPIALTDRLLGVSEFRWSPDSRTIAFLSREPEGGRYGSVEGITPTGEPARRITGVRYKSNGLGYTNDRRSHVFTVTRPALHGEPVYPGVPRADGTTPDDVAVPEATRVTTGDFDHTSIRWIGDRVAFLSARHGGRDRDLRNQVWTARAGEEPQALISPVLGIETFDTSEDGTVYLLAQELGEKGTDFVGRNTSLYRLDGGVATRLTDPETVDLGDVSTYLTIEGERVLVQDRTRGTRQLLEVRGPDNVSALSSGPIEITGQAASADHLVVTYSTPDTFGDVGILAGGVVTPLTDFSAALRATGLLEPAELTVGGRDGYPIHGWVMTPAGAGPHPTLLMIHGGPFAAYTGGVFDEPQVYADAGYAVVYCNPRGSAGYGQSHGRSIAGAMGDLDRNDVLEFLDGALAAHPSLDGSRLGILGGSYGGYLTAWIIAHDHRFAAAVAERGYFDPAAFVGSSDIGWFFPQEYNGTDHDLIRAQSPQEVAAQVTTPTLVIHSEDDLRCPLGQAETYYSTLRLNGVQSELLLFPGENHELSRSGRPRHRVQRFDAIIDWFGRHL